MREGRFEAIAIVFLGKTRPGVLRSDLIFDVSENEKIVNFEAITRKAPRELA